MADEKVTPPKPEMREIAAITRDITHPYVGQMLMPNDDTLAQRGGARSYRIYDDAERDGRVFSSMQKRKLALVSYPWVVDPASKSAIDKQAAEIVTAQLNDIKFRATVMDLMDAILKGFSVGEIMWKVLGDQIVVDKVIARDQRRFRFDIDYKLRLITTDNMIPGEVLPDRKFIVHQYGAKDGNPYGLGLGTRLYWYAFFKRQDLTFWLTFADKFGSPTTVGKYPAGTDLAGQAKLMAALRALSQEAGIAIPDDMVVELLQTTGSSSTDTYERLQRYLDETIAEIVLGESLSTSVGDVGSKAAAGVHNDVRLELSQADGELLAGSLNDTLIQWISLYNVPGATPPKLRFDVAAGEDLDARADRDKTISEMGFEPSEKYINETYDGEWTKKVVAPPPNLGPNIDAMDDQQFGEFVRKHDRRITSVLFADLQPDAVDRLSVRLAEEGAAPLSVMAGKVKELLDGATSLADFRDGLIGLYPDIKPAAFGEIMSSAILTSDLAGRAEVKASK